MPETVRKTGPITREEAIRRLRQELLKLTDDEHSMCRIAAERGLFCGGFRGMSDDDLRKRYWWIVRRRPEIGRAELESIANEWQLAQQEVREVPLACDVQTKMNDTCHGWNEFSNAQLAQFYQQVTGAVIEIA